MVEPQVIPKLNSLLNASNEGNFKSNGSEEQADERMCEQMQKLLELVEQFPQDSSEELEAIQNETQRLTRKIYSYTQHLEVCKKTLMVGQQIIDTYDYCDKALFELDEITLEASEVYSYYTEKKSQSELSKTIQTSL